MITFSKLGRYGQLGNQMFQYAMLLGVGANTGYRVKIPWNPEGRKKYGKTELDHFRISASRTEQFPERIYQEKGFAFDPDVFLQSDNIDYRGYFQSEKYFKHIEPQIRQEFRFVDPIEQYAMNYIANNRESEKIVSMHVRRGDYLEHPELFQVLSADYYSRAKQHWALPKGCQVFIFSDDLEWCKDNLTFRNAVFVDTPSHWHDMAIMQQCDHHIISAGTFSWWGAWISNKPDKVVIAPKPWFPINGPRGHYNMSTIVPEEWYELEVR